MDGAPASEKLASDGLAIVETLHDLSEEDGESRYANTDCHMMEVTADSVRWTCLLKHADVRLTTWDVPVRLFETLASMEETTKSALETVVDDDEQSLHADGRTHDQEDLLDRARKALPSLAHSYNDHGEYVEGDGDILAASVARTLIETYDPDPDCGDGSLIAHLTLILDQAMAAHTMVCAALEAEDATPEEEPRR